MYQDFKPPIYDTLYSMWRNSSKPCVPEQDRLDQAMLEVHLNRLGCGAVLRLGHPRAIYDRHFYLLNPNDISAVAKRQGDRIIIPAPFAEEYLGEDLPRIAEGYVDLSAVCAERQILLAYDEKTQVVCITPPDVRPVTRAADSAFLERMAFAFADPRLPMPKYNTSASTRMVIAERGFPQGMSNWMEKEYVNLYSPGLLVREENGKRVFYVSHENALGYSWGTEISTETVVLRSEDGGLTWEEYAVWPNIRWGYLFEVSGALYLCGNRHLPSQEIMIARVEQGKVTEAILPGHESLTNPHTTVIANGRVYIPTAPYILSAKIESDLLDPASWTASNSLEDCMNKEWFLNHSGCRSANSYWVLEGNMVQSPEGKLYNMLRLECQPNNGYAGLLEVSPDGKRQILDPRCAGLVEMPTAVSRFCVRYNKETGLYLALTSYPSLPTPETTPGAPMAGQRNILALVASSDLVHWKVLDILLSDTEVMNAFCSARAHGFQYVEWRTDGEDLIYVVREATGYNKHYHDGRFLTFYRLKNYRDFVLERFSNTEVYVNPYHLTNAPTD